MPSTFYGSSGLGTGKHLPDMPDLDDYPIQRLAAALCPEQDLIQAPRLIDRETCIRSRETTAARTVMASGDEPGT
jgi:hypothetical protein